MAQVTGEPARVPEVSAAAERLAGALEAARIETGRTWWESTRTGADAAGDRAEERTGERTNEHPHEHPAERIGDRAVDRSAERSADRARRDGRAAANALEAGRPAALIAAVAEALRASPRWQDQVMRAGWGFGLLAHTRRVPIHFALEDLDLLAGMLLDDVRERLHAEPMLDTADALAAARRLHDAASLLRLAALKGYTQAVSDELKRRFRTLRHDLRNPLGTIKSALALMEDETIPAETRASPRFRAMARKNATSMEALIRTTLGDSAALLPAFAHEPASLRAIAVAVRRDLRAEADARGVQIVVGDRLPTVRIDSAGFELTLKSVVLAVMRELPAPSEVLIDLAQMVERSAIVQVSAQPAGVVGAPLDPEDLAFARELASRSGGRVTRVAARSVSVEVPILLGEQPNDVGGPRERQHR